MRGPRALRTVLRALAVASFATLALGASPAAATFHVMQVREVYPGSASDPSSEYVELQMWAPGQNLVGGHALRSYDASGALVASDVFPADVPNGANQSTLLLATPEAEAQFRVRADAPLAPAGQLSPAGGAVCWEAIDCVAWGSFGGSLPSPAGRPAVPAGLPDGTALRRSISRGCPTALDLADDGDDSAADLAVVFPLPRPNSVPPSEIPCGAGGPGSPVAGAGTPQTFLRGKPARRTGDRTPTFRFRSDQRGARFECKLDRRPYRRCRSPHTTKPLSLGRHRFRVRARDREGRIDPTPASYRFRVVRRSA